MSLYDQILYTKWQAKLQELKNGTADGLISGPGNNPGKKQCAGFWMDLEHN